MDSDIQTRLKDTAEKCLDAYMTWDTKKKDKKAQEELHATIHAARKVLSRLEIELAMSERDQATSKPLPVPSHRSNTKGENVSILENEIVHDTGPVVQTKSRRRRPNPKKND